MPECRCKLSQKAENGNMPQLMPCMLLVSAFEMVQASGNEK
jgi:hypothetical protein